MEFIVEEISIISLALNVRHLVAFKTFYHDSVSWMGKVPRQFAETIGNVDPHLIQVLPAKLLTRADVKTFCADPENSVEACFLVCMAWGGMWPINARRAWAARERWIPILASMRDGSLTDRRAMYDSFLSPSIPGLGPAYFTKLMFFMSRGECCFIFDQWTGRSTNVLISSDKPLVHFSNTWLTRKNVADVYCRYCEVVEALAGMLDVSGEDIEEKMFAGGAHRWRDYVKQQIAAAPRTTGRVTERAKSCSGNCSAVRM